MYNKPFGFLDVAFAAAVDNMLSSSSLRCYPGFWRNLAMSSLPNTTDSSDCHLLPAAGDGCLFVSYTHADRRRLPGLACSNTLPMRWSS